MRCVLAAIMLVASAAIVLVASADAAGLPAGDIVVSAQISSTDAGLIEINPITGDRTIISDNTHGTGMPFNRPVGISPLPNGDLLVADTGTQDQTLFPNNPPPPGTPFRLYVVDPTTGNRTVISQDAMTSVLPPYPTYPQVGSGPAISASVFALQVGNQT